MTKPLLEVKNLKKYFPVTAGVLRHKVGDIKAVDGINFSIYPGQVLGMVGESGSGKSTAARTAIRLIEPTAGEVLLDGEDLLALSQEELRTKRKDVQIVFQDPYSSLNPRKTIG
jgi:ABC-type oligopeptide transport system ATPase subunit